MTKRKPVAFALFAASENGLKAELAKHGVEICLKSHRRALKKFVQATLAVHDLELATKNEFGALLRIAWAIAGRVSSNVEQRKSDAGR